MSSENLNLEAYKSNSEKIKELDFEIDSERANLENTSDETTKKQIQDKIKTLKNERLELIEVQINEIKKQNQILEQNISKIRDSLPKWQTSPELERLLEQSSNFEKEKKELETIYDIEKKVILDESREQRWDITVDAQTPSTDWWESLSSSGSLSSIFESLPSGIWDIIKMIIAFLVWFKRDAKLESSWWWGSDFFTSRTIRVYEKYENIPPESKNEFVTQSTPIAQNIEQKYGIPQTVSISQAILESWWWQSELAQKHGNYFGIKSHGKSGWIDMSTKEVKWWKAQTEIASFRTYSWLKDSFEWYADFLITNPRYKKAFAYGLDINPRPKHYPDNYVWYDPKRFIKEIVKAWYATDPQYADKIASISDRVENMA